MPATDGPDDRRILADLASTNHQNAWREFLRVYSPRLLGIARQYAVEEQEVADCYLFICEKLAEQRYRRLRQFDHDGPARFTTWLTSVTANLSIDWRRTRVGRPRPWRAIEALPNFERAVFACLYEQGLTRAECVAQLANRFPEIDLAGVARANGEIHRALSSAQRWSLTRRSVRDISLHDEHGELIPLSANPTSSPETLADGSEGRRLIGEALRRLSTPEQLLIRLRFEQELKFPEIARLMRLDDAQQARRLLQSALAKLRVVLDIPSAD